MQSWVLQFFLWCPLFESKNSDISQSQWAFQLGEVIPAILPRKNREVHKVISTPYQERLQMQEWRRFLPTFSWHFQAPPHHLSRRIIPQTKAGWQEPPLFIFFGVFYTYTPKPKDPHWRSRCCWVCFPFFLMHLPCCHIDFIYMCTSSARIQEIPWRCQTDQMSFRRFCGFSEARFSSYQLVAH